MRDDVRQAFERKRWKGPSRSGPGSTLPYTQRLRDALPGLLTRHNVRKFADVPCGDWHWMQHVDLGGVEYIGGDISAEIIEANQTNFGRPGVRFVHIDATSDPLPQADLFMCRDCLFHLTNDLRWAFLENFVASKSRLLLLSTHHCHRNIRVRNSGAYREFNVRIAPFFLPEPLEMIPETVDTLPKAPDERAKHRSLGVWTREHILDTLTRRDRNFDRAGQETLTPGAN